MLDGRYFIAFLVGWCMRRGVDGVEAGRVVMMEEC